MTDLLQMPWLGDQHQSVLFPLSHPLFLTLWFNQSSKVGLALKTLPNRQQAEELTVQFSLLKQVGGE